MKHVFVSILFLSSSLYSWTQNRLPYISRDKEFVFPNEFNKFITDQNVNWAFDAEQAFSFAGTTEILGDNIFNYLVKQVSRRKIGGYQLETIMNDFISFENGIYSENERFQDTSNSQSLVERLLSDSLKMIILHEIFYLDNYLLKCKIISSAPALEFYSTSGFDLGLHGIFYCCADSSSSATVRPSDRKNLVHLRTIERILNIDSIGYSKEFSLQYSKNIKKTFGLDLVETIWLGAAAGQIKLLDLETHQVIPTSEVLNYQVVIDTIPVLKRDSAGKLIYNHGKEMYDTTLDKMEAFPYRLPNVLQFTQDFYFDTRRNIFVSEISNCFLFVIHVDPQFRLTYQKRFQILPK